MRFGFPDEYIMFIKDYEITGSNEGPRLDEDIAMKGR